MNIIGEKVILRPITFDDTAFIIKWRNNPSVKTNFIYQSDFTQETHENWMSTKVASGAVVQYVIEDKAIGTPVGSIYFRDINHLHRKAEFGIFIGEDEARGKGYGQEATRLFVKFGVEKLDLHKIYLRVFANNIGAIRSYQKAGFIFEGWLKDDVNISGCFHDIVLMAYIQQR